MDNPISKEELAREELKRQYMLELGDAELTPELEMQMEESIELTLFLAKESESLQYSQSFENQIG